MNTLSKRHPHSAFLRFTPESPRAFTAMRASALANAAVKMEDNGASAISVHFKAGLANRFFAAANR